MYFPFLDNCYHFVCLVRHLDYVTATPVVVAEPGDSCIRFPSTLKLQDLYSDFKITLEIYSLETRAEVLPHEIKYHIHNSKKVHFNRFFLTLLISLIRLINSIIHIFFLYSLREKLRRNY